MGFLIPFLIFIGLGAAHFADRKKKAIHHKGHHHMGHDWDAKLQDLQTNNHMFESKVRETKHLLSLWPTWMEQYRGGMPRGIFASIMAIESGGRMSDLGDPSLGEVGWYQVTKEFPESIGVDPKHRYDKQWNMYLGGAEYNVRAAAWLHRLAQENVSFEDAWKLSRLSFAIGDHGARGVVDSWHKVAGGAPFTYEDLLAHVDKHGTSSYGSQSAAHVRYRVHLVDWNFRVGQAAEPGIYEKPRATVAPDGKTYT
jgi:hypothetical protein